MPSLRRVAYWLRRLLLQPGELRYAARRAVLRLTRRAQRPAVGAESLRSYEDWIAGQEAAWMLEGGAEEGPPFILLILWEGKTAAEWQRTLDSLHGQAYRKWECWIVYEEDQPPAMPVAWTAKERFLRRDDVLTAVTDYPDVWVGMLSAGDRLDRRALSLAAKRLLANPLVDLLYTDEDAFDAIGLRSAPVCKPGWSPETLLSWNYIGRLWLVRGALLARTGVIRAPVSPVEDYDLLLRASEVARGIDHLQEILLTRDGRQVRENIYGAVQSALERRGIPARAAPLVGQPGICRLEWQGRYPRASIVILTKDRYAFLRRCLESVFQKTAYPDFEVLLIDNGSQERATRELIAGWQVREPERFRTQRLDTPFNFSTLNNYAAEHSNGELLVFLNNDTEVIAPDWLAAMAGYGMLPQVGAVGALLLYPDDTVQHMGIALDAAETALHVDKGMPVTAPELPAAARNVSAVSAACLLVRKDRFLACGGFDEELTVSFGDVDLCLKLQMAGYRSVVVPGARLYHFESATRGYEDSPEKMARLAREKALLRQRWASHFEGDAYFPDPGMLYNCR